MTQLRHILTLWLLAIVVAVVPKDRSGGDLIWYLHNWALRGQKHLHGVTLRRPTRPTYRDDAGPGGWMS